MPIWSSVLLVIQLTFVGCSNSKNVEPPEGAGHVQFAAKDETPDNQPRNHGTEKPDEGTKRDGEDTKGPLVLQPIRDGAKSPKEIVMQEYKTPQGLIVKLNVDHDPWADAVVSFHRGKPAPKKNDNPWH